MSLGMNVFGSFSSLLLPPMIIDMYESRVGERVDSYLTRDNLLMCLSFITKPCWSSLVKATHETFKSPDYDLIVQLFSTLYTWNWIKIKFNSTSLFLPSRRSVFAFFAWSTLDNSRPIAYASVIYSRFGLAFFVWDFLCSRLKSSRISAAKLSADLLLTGMPQSVLACSLSFSLSSCSLCNSKMLPFSFAGDLLTDFCAFLRVFIFCCLSSLYAAQG